MSILTDPRVPDPYESRLVEVRSSEIEGGNEGLFAKRFLEVLEIRSIVSICCVIERLFAKCYQEALVYKCCNLFFYETNKAAKLNAEIGDPLPRASFSLSIISIDFR